MYFYRFFPFLCKGLCILYHKDEIAATACAGHFPGEDFRQGGVYVYIWLHACLLAQLSVYGWINHSREHSRLRLERGEIGGCKALQVVAEYGFPAGVSGSSQSCNLRFVDVFLSIFIVVLYVFQSLPPFPLQRP